MASLQAMQERETQQLNHSAKEVARLLMGLEAAATSDNKSVFVERAKSVMSTFEPRREEGR